MVVNGDKTKECPNEKASQKQQSNCIKLIPFFSLSLPLFLCKLMKQTEFAAANQLTQKKIFR